MINYTRLAQNVNLILLKVLDFGLIKYEAV